VARGRAGRSHVARAAAEEVGSLSGYELQRLLDATQKRADSVLQSQGFGTPDWKEAEEEARTAANDPDLWNDSAKAQKVMLRVKDFDRAQERATRFEEAAQEMATALELAGEESEAQAFLEEAKAVHDTWLAEVLQAEVEVLMQGNFDSAGCQLTIYAGAGGDEACDWVTMLERMYTNYSGDKGWKVKKVDFTPGDSIGMKSVDLEVEGDYVYGQLKGEEGAHRLVRVWNGKRQTSFAGVEVSPVMPEDSLKDVELNDGDLKFATFRCGGKGGQNVNKVETGVRVEHTPTGITVKCTEERSQLMNREKCLKKLKEKLVAMQERLQAEAISEIKGDAVQAQWGAQVRNYVLQPYTMIKDLRSGHERGDADRVLGGDLGSHIDAYLRCSSK